MLSKNQIKYIQSLQQKKVRNEEQCFVAEGVKVVEDILVSGNLVVKEIFAVQEWIVAHINQVLDTINLVEVKEDELQRLSGLTTANKVLAVVAMPDYKWNIEELKQKNCIALDGINDPGNLGTIIRLADWFGIDTILATTDTVDCFNPKVVQATMGSIARVKVIYEDLKEKLPLLQLPIYATSLTGTNMYEQKFVQPAVLLMGSESHGVSKELLAISTNTILIPSYNTNLQKAESLNVGIATAIVCSEFFRGIK